MLNNVTFRNFAFEGIDKYILKVYAKNVADSLLNGLRGKMELVVGLYDFESMKDEQGRSINDLFAIQGINYFKRDAELSGSDVTEINTSNFYWSKLGKLQSVCLAYNEVPDAPVSKTLCVGSLILFRLMIIRKLFDDITDITDKRVTTAIKRLTVPKLKKLNDKKVRNLYSDLLLGNDKGVHVFCGPKIEFGEAKGNNIELKFSNSLGMNVSDTLIVPIAFMYIIDDLFQMMMNGGKLANGIKGNYSANELEIINYIQPYIVNIIGDKRFNAFNLCSLNNKNGLIKELAAEKEIKGWGKKNVYAHKKGITLSEIVIHSIYGDRDKKTNMYIPNEKSTEKVNRGKNNLGFSLPSADIYFYNTKSESNNTELLAFDPYSFAYIRTYSSEEVKKDIKNREKSERYHRFIMLSTYLDYFDDKIFVPEKDRLLCIDRLWYLTSVPDDIKKNLYSDDHYKFMINSAKYYSASDIREIVDDTELSTLYYDFDDRCMKKNKALGLKSGSINVDLPKADKNMSEDEILEVRKKRKNIIMKALNSGICEVEYKNKGSNKTYVCYLTYNKDLIKQRFGEDYIGKYSSLRYRLEKLSKRIEDAKNINDLNKALNDLAITQIMGKEIILARGNKVVCGIIKPSSNFETYKSAIDTFIKNMMIDMKIKSSDDAVSIKDDINKPICTVNLLASKRYDILDKNGNEGFNRWITESGVVKISLLK